MQMMLFYNENIFECLKICMQQDHIKPAFQVVLASYGKCYAHGHNILIIPNFTAKHKNLSNEHVRWLEGIHIISL